MDTKTLLSLAGLSKREAAVYEVLVHHGPASIAQIERDSGLHRPTVYQTLPALKDRGLVSERMVGKRTMYVPAPPEVLLPHIESAKNTIDEAVNDLEASYKQRGGRPIVQYHEGKSGVRRTIEDLLYTSKRGDLYFRYGSRKPGESSRRYWPKGFGVKRDKKQLERLVITSTERAATYKKDLGRTVKTVPEQVLFDDDVQLMIYGDKISIIDFTSETGIIIEHKTLANFQKKLFKLLYDRL